MNIKTATDFATNFVKNHPEHFDEVTDLFDLMKDEINGGESETNEVELFIGACEDLLIED